MKENQSNMRQWCMTANTLSFQDKESCSNQDCRIVLDIVKTQHQRNIFKRIIKEYHSYVPQSFNVGRRIDWLIKCNGDLIGAIGIGSSVYPEPKDLSNFIGWDREKQKRNFNYVANNWRFCLINNLPKNIGSKTLSIFLKVAKKEWFNKYNNQLVLLITFVEHNHNGTIYYANGWQMIGHTKGMVKKGAFTTKKNWDYKFSENKDNKKVMYSDKKIKKIFVKPLHRYWKKKLMG